jgi:hypothetical protein
VDDDVPRRLGRCPPAPAQQNPAKAKPAAPTRPTGAEGLAAGVATTNIAKAATAK